MFIEAIKQNKVKMSGMAWAWSVSQRYIIGGPETRMPSDFELFLANDDNKTQRRKLLREVWGSIISITVVVVVVEGKAYQLVVRWQREYIHMIYL